jgi:hypothetical protein
MDYIYFCSAETAGMETLATGEVVESGRIPDLHLQLLMVDASIQCP